MAKYLLPEGGNMTPRRDATAVLLLLSLALFVAAFVSPAWRRDSWAVKNSWDGLWYSCYAWPQTDDAKFVSVQVMMSLALASYVVAIILLFVKLCGTGFDESRARIGLACISFLAVTFNVIGLTIYGVDNGKSLHWSYGLAAASGVLTFAGGVAAAVQGRC